MSKININELEWPRAKPVPLSAKPPRHRPGERFVKGPVPMPWIAQASQLRGGALAVGLMLWHKAGILDCCTVPYCHGHAVKVGVRYQASYRAIKALEKAKLIAVVRTAGRSLAVTILETPPSP